MDSVRTPEARPARAASLAGRAARRIVRVTLRWLLLAALLIVAIALLAPRAHAEGPSADEKPIMRVLVTAGLTWDDVTTETPALQCLAGRSGVAAMNTTSDAPVSTLPQGIEALRTGYRGGVDATATDLAAVGDTSLPPHRTDLLAQVRDSVVLVPMPSVAPAGSPDHGATLRALDEEVAKELAAQGGCSSRTLPRTLLASVAAAGDETHADARQTMGVLIDTGRRGDLLTSGATHQSGIVTVTDLLPTILASHGKAVPPALPGQVIEAVPTPDAIAIARDRTDAAALVDRATPWALVPWVVPGVLGLVVLLTPLRRGRPRLASAARIALVLAPLVVPAGLCAGIVPWWRGEHPTLMLALVTWAGAALLSAVVLGGPWRRSALARSAVSGGLVAGVILLESATGSRLQLSSPLGAQPIVGGRYYGLSNHLYGAVLAGTLVALIGICSLLRTRRTRVLVVIAVGAAVAAVCVLPTMGADFGSMLGTVPTIGLLALLVSGVRPRLWHILVLGIGGAAAVMCVALLDWLRPPEQRSHLGRFIDDILTGQLFDVIARKLAQNIGMLLGIWPLLIIALLALAATAIVLWPERLHAWRVVRLCAAVPPARPALVSLAFGTWLGYAVNDTGPVLVAASLGVALALVVPLLPEAVSGSRAPGGWRPSPRRAAAGGSRALG